MSKRKKIPGVSSQKNTSRLADQTSVFKIGAPFLVLVLAVIGFGALLNSNSPSTSRQPAMLRTATAVQPLTPPEYGAANPAKEYIYGGGKLIAVTEPVNPAPIDLAVWRVSTGTWWVLDGSNTTQAFGLSTDIPQPGDYDGDGKTDFCVYRPTEGNWYLLLSGSNNTLGVHAFGNEDDVPAPADYNGDGKTEFAVFRPSNTTWYIQDTTQGFLGSWVFGNGTDKPVAGDYDGDGKADIAVWRNVDATWWVLQSSDSTWSFLQWGVSGDKPVPGDYDGDRKTDFAVWQENNGWKIHKSSTGSAASPTTTWGIKTSDIPVQADYDADGKTDIACWRPSNGTWYIIKSSGGERVQPWGTEGDFPVPGPYRR